MLKPLLDDLSCRSNVYDVSRFDFGWLRADRELASSVIAMVACDELEYAIATIQADERADEREAPADGDHDVIIVAFPRHGNRHIRFTLTIANGLSGVCG
jgi:hypothetical protein